MAVDIGGCSGADSRGRVKHGECLACQLRASVYVLLSVGQKMRQHGRAEEFTDILMGTAVVVTTGDQVLIEQVVADIMTVPCSLPAAVVA